jgi:hypothetical protein
MLSANVGFSSFDQDSSLNKRASGTGQLFAMNHLISQSSLNQACNHKYISNKRKYRFKMRKNLIEKEQYFISTVIIQIVFQCFSLIKKLVQDFNQNLTTQY